MNKIVLNGTPSDIKLSHECYNEKFYQLYMTVERISGTKDVLPCIVPELFTKQIKEGEPIKVIGEVRTANSHTETADRVLVRVFVTEIGEYEGKDNNGVEIEGYLCKEPVYRTTPLGREITDLIIASNREHTRKSDYIPSICWGRTAKIMNLLDVGTKVAGKGRLQSRTYSKNVGDITEVRAAYELSLCYINECDGNE